jgi:hypothetical protein
MTRGPGKRSVPPRVDEFDDEDDTVVELKSGSDSGAAVGSTTKPVPIGELAEIGDEDDDDEDEATELLPRIAPKASTSGPVSASKSAVRLEGPQSTPSAEGDDDDDDDLDDETLALPDLAAARAAAEAAPPSETAVGAEESTVDHVDDDDALAEDEDDDQRHPPIRPLSSLPKADFEDPTTSTRSSPNVVRMTFQGQERSAPRATPPGTSVGTLLIDAPEDAVVHIDGTEHPPGPVKLENVSRFTKFKVRVIREGHAPWSATLSLNGKRAARIRPTLVKGPGS